MTIIRQKISQEDLKTMAALRFGDMVKGVVDVDRELVALDAELHSDLESQLLEDGSHQIHLWGINLYPEISGDDFIEYDSAINLRPSAGNRSRGVESEEIRKKIVQIVLKWIKR